jgi:hypothetical protein
VQSSWKILAQLSQHMCARAYASLTGRRCKDRELGRAIDGFEILGALLVMKIVRGLCTCQHLLPLCEAGRRCIGSRPWALVHEHGHKHVLTVVLNDFIMHELVGDGVCRTRWLYTDCLLLR